MLIVHLLQKLELALGLWQHRSPDRFEKRVDLFWSLQTRLIHTLLGFSSYSKGAAHSRQRKMSIAFKAKQRSQCMPRVDKPAADVEHRRRQHTGPLKNGDVAIDTSRGEESLVYKLACLFLRNVTKQALHNAQATN